MLGTFIKRHVKDKTEKEQYSDAGDRTRVLNSLELPVQQRTSITKVWRIILFIYLLALKFDTKRFYTTVNFKVQVYNFEQ